MRRAPILLLLVALTACSPAAPPTPPAPTDTSAAPATPRVELPPRPRDLPIDGIDPCDLLTDAQRTELGINDQPQTNPGSSALLGETVSCDMVGFEPRAIGVSITLAFNTGIERFTMGQIAGEITATSVAGQPAVIARPAFTTTFCSVEIDVADQQLVDVQFGQSFSEEPIPQDQLCRDAELVAEYTVLNLLAG